jgi:hypothetical protein
MTEALQVECKIAAKFVTSHEHIQNFFEAFWEAAIEGQSRMNGNSFFFEVSFNNFAFFANSKDTFYANTNDFWELDHSKE